MLKQLTNSSIVGRILNRFSKDMGAVDELLPRAMLDALQVLMVMIGILAMVFLVTPWMIIPTAVLCPLFYFFRNVYLITAQAIKRWEGVSKYLPDNNFTFSTVIFCIIHLIYF